MTHFYRLQATFILLVAALSGSLFAQTTTHVTVTPTGIFATIDTSRSVTAIKALASGSDEQKRATLSEIDATPEVFLPPVFYATSRELAARNDLDKALFWFYAGQLRARYDANRCADLSARSAVAALNTQMPDSVRKHQFAIVDRLEGVVRSVLDWDEKTPYRYDHRWINLHGIAAIKSGMGEPVSNDLVISLPEAQWESVRKKTRDEWLIGFLQVLPNLRKTAEQQGLR